MPIYQYKCKDCGHVFEQIVKNDKTVPQCPAIFIDGAFEKICGRECEKIISKSSFRLKGSGWARDGYSKPNKGK